MLDWKGQDLAILKTKGTHQLAVIQGMAIAMTLMPMRCQAEYVSQRCSELVSQAAYEKALAYCSEEIRLYPQNAVLYNRRGVIYSKLGQYEAAIADYNAALTGVPQSTLVYANRCLAYYKLGNYPAALADCTQAIDLNPEFPMSYVIRAKTRTAIANKPGAIADYRQAIDLFSKQGQKTPANLLSKELETLQN